jgi:hypothetical protein
MPYGLTDMLDEIFKVVHFTKIRPLKARLFPQLVRFGNPKYFTIAAYDYTLVEQKQTTWLVFELTVEIAAVDAHISFVLSAS